jgi:Spy/CpxP family protein refolding chaperone
MADEAILRAKVRAEVFAILTPEQQQKANEMRSSMQQRRQRR